MVRGTLSPKPRLSFPQKPQWSPQELRAWATGARACARASVVGVREGAGGDGAGSALLLPPPFSLAALPWSPRASSFPDDNLGGPTPVVLARRRRPVARVRPPGWALCGPRSSYFVMTVEERIARATQRMSEHVTQAWERSLPCCCSASCLDRLAAAVGNPMGMSPADHRTGIGAAECG